MKKLCLALALGFLGMTTGINAQKAPVLEFYHGAECPHCHEEKKFFPTLKQMYPELTIQEFEVWHNADNAQKARTRLAELGQVFEAVPTNIIANEVVVGFQKQRILDLLAKHYGEPAISEADAEIIESENNHDTLFIVIILAGIIIAVTLLWNRRKGGK